MPPRTAEVYPFFFSTCRVLSLSVYLLSTSSRRQGHHGTPVSDTTTAPTRTQRLQQEQEQEKQQQQQLQQNENKTYTTRADDNYVGVLRSPKEGKIWLQILRLE